MPHTLFTLLAALLFALSIIPSAVLATPTGVVEARAPKPSASCPFSCPGKDNANFKLDKANTKTVNGALFCNYPSQKNQDPNVFFCLYNTNTGFLKVNGDHDAGECPSSADLDCQSRRRSAHARDALPRALAPSAEVARDVRPELMQVRNSLKKKRND